MSTNQLNILYLMNSTLPFKRALFISLILFSSGCVMAEGSKQKTNQLIDIDDVYYNLMLAGGGLKTCSSFFPKNCKKGKFDETARTESRYELSEKTLNSLQNSRVFSSQPSELKQKLNIIFQHFHANPETVADTSGIKQAFGNSTEQFAADRFFRYLPNDIYYAIQDYTETAQNKTEKVNLSDNKNLASVAIYKEFLRLANLKSDKEKPLTIRVMTSSSRDSFSTADFYQDVFADAARLALPEREVNVEWLPLDRSLAKAIELESQGISGCSQLENIRAENSVYSRATAWPKYSKLQDKYCQAPDALQQLIEESDGIFINGGDQSLTLRAFKNTNGSDNRFLKTLKNKLKENTLILGGTSAGTAVQGGGEFLSRPIPMISSGHPAVAFARGAFPLPPPDVGCEKDKNCSHGLLEEDLTYNPAGGLASFNLGVSDTHFSERDREARLALLTSITGTRFGFGVDEATALLVHQKPSGDAFLKVIGGDGVFIADMQNSVFMRRLGKHQIAGISHFLNQGDMASYSSTTQEFKVFFNDDSRLLKDKTKVRMDSPGEFRQQVSNNCGTDDVHKWQWEGINFTIQPDNNTEFSKNESFGKAKCSYSNLMFAIEN